MSKKPRKDLTSAAPLPPQLTLLLASLVKLGDKLAAAFDSNPEQHSVYDERARYIQALRAMSDFLRANKAPLHFSQQFNRLAVAISDLNEGRTDTLLAPTPTGGVNPGAQTAQWLGRANVALGMAALIAAGKTRKPAAKEAERTTGIDVSKLLSWYDEFRKPPDRSRIKNFLARALFDNGQQMIELVMQDVPAARALADHFLALAARQLRNQS
jgi:hypothetical protein